MRKSIFALCSLVLLNHSTSTAQKNDPMKELVTEITISAPVETVWKHLTDLSAYSSWNPFIVKSEGEIALGNRITNVMMNGGKPTTFKPEITLVEPQQRFEWIGKLPLGIFNGNHYFYLEKLDANTTKLIHGERFSGLLRGLIMNRVGENTRLGFIAMNDALKARCER